jgi:hypothetical protein
MHCVHSCRHPDDSMCQQMECMQVLAADATHEASESDGLRTNAGSLWHDELHATSLPKRSEALIMPGVPFTYRAC